MASALTSHLSFGSVEQLDEIMRSLSWPTEYRQLEPAPFSSRVDVLEGGSWFLVEEETSCLMEVTGGAADGMYTMALIDGGDAIFNGIAVTENHVLTLGPGASFRATLPPGITVTQFGVVAEQFEEAAGRIVARLGVPRSSSSVFEIERGKLAGLRKAMQMALFAPSDREMIRDEAASLILAELLAMLADHGEADRTRVVSRVSARSAIDKAREYIEGHVDEAIKVMPLCEYAGTNIRSLERVFVRELGVPPQQYIRARRFNAVRRELLAADESMGVAVLAKNHGFTHMGRFAGEYRGYFGESPSDTLQRN